MSFYIRNFFKFKPFIVGAGTIRNKKQYKQLDRSFYEVEGGRFRFDEEVLNESEFVRTKRIDDTRRIIVTGMKNENLHGIALAISVNGEYVFKAAIGVRDVENNKIATADMRGNIASITKIYTAYLIMKMFEENKFREGGKQWLYLCTEIQSNYFLDGCDKHIFSLAHLLLHQGDIRHYGNQENYDVDQFDTLQSVWRKLYRFYRPLGTNLIFYSIHDDQKDGISPNRITRYTSLGYDVLGAFMEKMKDDVPYYNILTDELRHLNMSDTVLPRVEDVIFDVCRGYDFTDVCETHIIDHDQRLMKMKRDEQVVEEFQYIPQPQYRRVVSNCHYVNYSKKYPSEGLVANVSDLLKFGDMFLRMDQDLSGGKPLSAGLAKLMWSYRGDGDDFLADAYGRHLDALIQYRSRCLGWVVTKNLHKQSGSGEKFRMSAHHNGSCMGFISSLYVTSMKEENYLTLNDFSFAYKAIEMRSSFVQRLKNRANRVITDHRAMSNCPSSCLNCFSCPGDEDILPGGDTQSQLSRQEETTLLPDSCNSSISGDNQPQQIQPPHNESLTTQAQSLPKFPLSSQSPDRLSSHSHTKSLPMPPRDHSFDDELSQHSSIDSQSLLLPDSSQTRHRSDQSQSHASNSQPQSNQNTPSYTPVPQCLLPMPPRDHLFDDKLSQHSSIDSQSLLLPDSSQTRHQSDQSQSHASNSQPQSNQNTPSYTPVPQYLLPMPPRDHSFDDELSQHSSIDSQSLLLPDSSQTRHQSNQRQSHASNSQPQSNTPVPHCDSQHSGPITGQPQSQSQSQLSRPSSIPSATLPQSMWDSHNSNQSHEHSPSPITRQPQSSGQRYNARSGRVELDYEAEREEEMRANCNPASPRRPPQNRQQRNDSQFYQTLRRWMCIEGGIDDFADLVLGEGEYAREVFSKVEQPSGITIAMIVNKDMYKGTEELAEQLTSLYLEDIAGFGSGDVEQPD